MEIKKEKIENDNGSYTEIEKVETTPEDGFVHKADIHQADINNYGKYQKGYSKSVISTTNDPRITRPIAYSICGISSIIGIVLLLLHSWFLGFIFTAISVFSFFKSKKDIDKMEQKLKESENDKEK